MHEGILHVLTNIGADVGDHIYASGGHRLGADQRRSFFQRWQDERICFAHEVSYILPVAEKNDASVAVREQLDIFSGSGDEAAGNVENPTPRPPGAAPRIDGEVNALANRSLPCKKHRERLAGSRRLAAGIEVCFIEPILVAKQLAGGKASFAESLRNKLRWTQQKIS